VRVSHCTVSDSCKARHNACRGDAHQTARTGCVQCEPYGDWSTYRNAHVHAHTQRARQHSEPKTKHSRVTSSDSHTRFHAEQTKIPTTTTLVTMSKLPYGTPTRAATKTHTQAVVATVYTHAPNTVPRKALAPRLTDTNTGWVTTSRLLPDKPVAHTDVPVVLVPRNSSCSLRHHIK
jgi:hypothetical protein